MEFPTMDAAISADHDAGETARREAF